MRLFILDCFEESKQSKKKKPLAKTITQKTKGKAKERPKDAQHVGTKEGRELVPLVVGSYLTHNPHACKS
jgi:hypothetical protein